MNPGRNDPCTCGSRKKYKRCCGNPESRLPVQSWQQKAHAAMLNLPAKGAAPAPDEFGQLVALYNAGRHAELESRARLLVERHPDFGLGWKLLSASLLMQGKDALFALQNATRLVPDEAELHNNLGHILTKQDRGAEAEVSFRRALEIKPDYADAHYNLGRVLADQSRFAEAEACLRRALKINPDFAEAHNNLGSVLVDQDRFAEAEASLLRALEINPGFAEARNCLGNVFTKQGRLSEAETNIRLALKNDPYFLEARFSLARVRKVRAGDENLAALIAAEEAARNGIMPLSIKEMTSLHFVLGKSYDDIGDHEKAFPHFLEGNRLKRSTFDYDPVRAARHFAGITRNFDEATIGRLRGGGAPSHLPIFVLGMPRSGTTLIEQIIATHPEVHGAGELHDLMAIARREIAGATFPDNLPLLNQARLTAWGADYVAGLQRRAPDMRRITDKMPANFFAVGLIHLMLPNAKIIHVNRNPVDTCLSCFTQFFSNGQEHTYDLAELGRYYVDYVRLMEHWRKVLPEGAFLDVRYEDIVADQEAQSRRLIEYCGLEWNDACIDFHQNKRAVHTASVVQVRQPMYKSSVERWRPYEKLLGPLFDALGEFAPDY